MCGFIEMTCTSIGGGVVDNMLDYQSRNLKIDPPASLVFLDGTLN